MQNKLRESRMMRAAAVIPDCVRQVSTPKLLSPPSPPPSCDLPCSLSLPGSLRCQSRAPSFEKQHESHAGVIKDSHSHAAKHKLSLPLWLVYASQLWRQAFYCFHFPFSMWSLTLSMRGPTASDSLVARWPQVHKSAYRQRGNKSEDALFFKDFACEAARRRTEQKLGLQTATLMQLVWVVIVT